MESIKKRVSIRKYTNQEISDRLLLDLLEEAERTPTMGNLQLYSVVATRSEEGKKKLSPFHFNQPMVMSAPVVLTFCADFRRTTQWCKFRKADPGYDNLLSFLNAASDTLLYVQNFCTLAEAAGLGTCYLGTTIYTSEGIIDCLGLPELVFPVATITVGYPAETPAQSDRLPVRAIVHNEKYSDYDEQSIDDLYSLKESLPENKHYVEINNKETLAQIFTDIRYTRKDNEAISESLLKALKKQKFI